MDPAKKKRGENWSLEEKEILRQLLEHSANILEDKSTKTNINNLKLKEWKNLTQKFNHITGKCRSEAEIKLAWKRMKLAAKANLSVHKREQSQTGGGTKPPSPSPEDLQIMAIAPHHFVIEVNDFDSDAVIPNVKVTKFEPTPGPSSQVDPVILINEETPGLNQIPVSEDIKSAEHLLKAKRRCRPKIEIKGRKVLQNRSEEGRQAIINSNIDLKKRHMEMLEVEHVHNIKIKK